MPILREVENIATAIAGHTVTASNYHGRGKLFEMWLMFRIARRLQRLGSTVTLHRSDGSPVGTTFRLRGAPGGIHPIGDGPNHPGYIAFTTQLGNEYELHNSVEFLGRSNATHEYDVCAISKEIGDALRGKTAMESPLGHPMFALECKQYETASAGIGEARSLLGQLFDCTYWGEAACTGDNWNVASDDNNLTHLKASYLRFARSFPALVAEGGISAGARDLGNMFHLRMFQAVRHGSQAARNFVNSSARWLYNL